MTPAAPAYDALVLAVALFGCGGSAPCGRGRTWGVDDEFGASARPRCAPRRDRGDRRKLDARRADRAGTRALAQEPQEDLSGAASRDGARDTAKGPAAKKRRSGQATVLALPTKPASARYLRPIDPAIDTNRGRRHPQAAEWLGPTPVAHSRADLIRLARMPAPTRHRVPYGPGRGRQTSNQRSRIFVGVAAPSRRPHRERDRTTALLTGDFALEGARMPDASCHRSLPISCAPNGSTLRGVSRPDTSCPSGGEVRRARPRMRYRAERK